MPHHEQQIEFLSSDTTLPLALAIGTFHHLGWTIEFVHGNRIVGYTKKKWNQYYDHITVDVDRNGLLVNSRLPDSASFDLLKKNKKNVNNFIQAFETTKGLADDEKQNSWLNELAELRIQTAASLEKEEKTAAEVDAVMNLSGGSRMVTYTIMAVNLIVFIAMLVSGVSAFEPLISDIVKWGGNVKSYTLNGEWWRLISSTFIHIGVIHIVFNMYALYMVGVYLEPMLGKARYIAAYLCTGIIASIASTWWMGNQQVSAGASGAIFGLYGVFLALLTTKLIPVTMRKSLLQSIGIFVAYNIIYGAKSDTTDNAAHLGGLFSGLAIGYLYFF
jgi:rhomboid protease GluP